MKSSIQSKVWFPLKGRIWLPPDCESVEVLIGKLWNHHYAEGSALHRGAEHVEKHRSLMNQATLAFTYFANISP